MTAETQNSSHEMLLPAYEGISTSVERPLQIHLFMQNEPNFRKAKINLSLYLTKDYEKNQTSAAPKTNPNEPNFSGLTTTVFSLQSRVMAHTAKRKKKKRNLFKDYLAYLFLRILVVFLYLFDVETNLNTACFLGRSLVFFIILCQI